MAELDYCAQLVRETDKDRFLASLFVPQPQRSAVLALYAFDGEIRRVAASVREPLAGEIRLQWWHDVISGRNPEQAAGSPVAAELAAALARYDLPRDPLLLVVEAHRLDLYREPLASIADLEATLANQIAGLFLSSALILGAQKGPQQETLARHAGIAFGLTRRLAAFPQDIAQGRLVVPQDLQKRHGLDPEQMLTRQNSPRLRAALADLRSLARGHLSEASALLGDDSAGAYLPLSLIRPLLARMDRSGYDPFTPPELSQIRRQWHLWRASRNLRRAI